MLSYFQWYRQWRGGRWVRHVFYGWRWVGPNYTDAVDEDYGYPHRHDFGPWQRRTCKTCDYTEIDCQRKLPALYE